MTVYSIRKRVYATMKILIRKLFTNMMPRLHNWFKMWPIQRFLASTVNVIDVNSEILFCELEFCIQFNTCYVGTRNINIVLFLVIISETANFDILSLVNYNKILVYTKPPYIVVTRHISWSQNSTEMLLWLGLRPGLDRGIYSAHQTL